MSTAGLSGSSPVYSVIQNGCHMDEYIVRRKFIRMLLYNGRCIGLESAVSCIEMILKKVMTSDELKASSALGRLNRSRFFGSIRKPNACPSNTF